jgi:hypothetical protein
MEGRRMELLKALRIVDGMSGHGESANPVYPEKNLLPDCATLHDLRLEIVEAWERPAGEGQIYFVEVHLAKPGGEFKPVAKLTLEGPVTFPIALTLDKQYLVEGVSRIVFRVYTHNKQTYESKVARFTIDKRMPMDGARPVKAIVDEEVSSGPGVTEAYLKAHCDMVKVTIPAYDGFKKGDFACIYYGPINPPRIAQAVLNESGGETVMALPRSIFRALGNGAYILHYRLNNRAGVQTQNSLGVFIRVSFPE